MSRKPRRVGGEVQAPAVDRTPTAGEGGTASETAEGQSMTATKHDVGATDPKTEKRAERKAEREGIEAARARLKKARGYSDAEVASMNEDAVYSALAQLDARADRDAQKADRDAQHNERYQQVGAASATPGMNSGYTRGSS